MTIIRDIQYAIRLLAKSPGFTLLTTLIMASGIGLSVYLFSMMNSLLFKDLPFENSDTLVRISTSQNGSIGYGRFNLHDYYEVRTSIEGLAEIGAYIPISVNVYGRDGARRYKATSAEANFFQLTRTKPILGREFSSAETRQGAEYVVVIGYDIWQNQYGGDAQVLGETLRIDGIGHRIIGVMPQGYLFPLDSELWIPMRQDATSLARNESAPVYGVAHLDDGVSIRDINRQLTVIMQRLEEKYPATNSGIGAHVEKFQGNPGKVFVYSMYISALLIMILASLNVGNLLFSRAVERGKETAIRVALGAPRTRLISQMLWESIIICGIGGIIGSLVLAWGLEVTQAVHATFSPDKPAFWVKFGIDGYTIKLLLLFFVSTTIITGLLPAWKNSGEDFNAILRDGTRGAQGKKAGRINRFLVVSEIFISITVLITAGILIVASYKATNADLGVKTENFLVAKIIMPKVDYDSPEKQAQFSRTLQSRLENGFGIGDVILASAIPGDFTSPVAIALDGKEYTQDGGYPRVNYILVTPASLEKLGVELKEGRYFNNGDDGLNKKSVIVTDSFASRYFPNETALGKRVRIVEQNGDTPEWLTIVGVVGHTIYGSSLGHQARIPSIFRPFTQAPGNELIVTMQMQSDRSVVTRTLRSTLESIDPALPAFRIETYTDRLARYNAPLKFISTIFLLFGIATVALAASGIYGVMSNTIRQRTQEIGVKRALGAMEQQITREFLTTGFKQLLWGGIPGLMVGCAMGYALSTGIGIESTDLLMLSVILSSIISCVVLFATWIPTRRALQIGPSEALRYE